MANAAVPVTGMAAAGLKGDEPRAAPRLLAKEKQCCDLATD